MSFFDWIGGNSSLFLAIAALVGALVGFSKEIREWLVWLRSREEKRPPKRQRRWPVIAISLLLIVGVIVFFSIRRTLPPVPVIFPQHEPATSSQPSTLGQGVAIQEFAVVAKARPQDWRVDILTATSINVREGNTLVFTPSGQWSVGAGLVGPSGKEGWCECVIAERAGAGFRGFLGALIGRIGQHGQPFLIGVGRTIRAGESGVLFLGANDNMGPCDGVSRGSCFLDNTGEMSVRVEVK